MLSLRELQRAARILCDRFAGARVERWLQPDGQRLVVSLYRRDPDTGAAGKHHLLLSAAPEVARISEIESPPKALDQPPALSAFLRSHLSRARLVRASIRGDDRQLAIRFEARDGDWELLLALLGRRSNVYLLDAFGVVRAALRPPRDTRPEITLGAAFQAPGGALADAGEDRFAGVDDAHFLAAVEARYGGRESEQQAEDLSRSLLRALRREKKNAQRRLEKVESELAEADQVSELQRRGELLKVALAEVSPGASEVTVHDWERDEDVVVPLDPTKSARANMEAIFKRYHKLLRRLTKAGGQLDAARAWCDELRGLEARCEALAEAGADEDARAELEEIAGRPEIARLLDRPAPGGRDQPVGAQQAKKTSLPPLLQNLPRRLLPRRYRSRDGLEIWVGRSDEANDHLSTRLARGKDLFFHLDGAPGSHVVLRTEGRSDPPQESLLDACELAVHFSKQKNAGRADVHVVPIRNVKKPRGAKKGLVYVTGGKTVHLRREEARLERLLASRIDDP